MKCHLKNLVLPLKLQRHGPTTVFPSSLPADGVFGRPARPLPCIFQLPLSPLFLSPSNFFPGPKENLNSPYNRRRAPRKKNLFSPHPKTSRANRLLAPHALPTPFEHSAIAPAPGPSFGSKDFPAD